MPELEGRYCAWSCCPDRQTVHNAFFDRGFKPLRIRYFADTDTLYIDWCLSSKDRELVAAGLATKLTER